MVYDRLEHAESLLAGKAAETKAILERLERMEASKAAGTGAIPQRRDGAAPAVSTTTPNKPRRPLVYGGLGAPNLGDEAIFAGIAAFYDKEFPGSTLYVATHNSNYTSVVHASEPCRLACCDNIASLCVETDFGIPLANGDADPLLRLVFDREHDQNTD
jgi:hypothetical protein